MLKTILASSVAVGALLFTSGASAGAGDDYPPNAVPGHCYQRVFLPESTETYQEKIIDSPERVETRIIPAVYGVEQKQIVVREARTEYITIPATYRTVTETVVITQETTRTEFIPATYETVTEQVLVREAHTEWRPGKPHMGKEYGYGYEHPRSVRVLPTGDVLCLVEVPAEYRSITRQVLKTPGHTVTMTIPGESRTITRQIIDQPAHVEKREIPAEYSTVTIRVITTPERTETYTVPATYKYVTKTRVLVSSHFDWREYECHQVIHTEDQGPAPHHYQRYESHPVHPDADDGERGALPSPVTPGFDYRTRELSANTAAASHQVGGDPQVAHMQAALSKRGYYQGPIDGLFTIATGNAMTKFQRDHDLPLGAYNWATAQALGLQ
jgi:hypothetical protein